MNQSCPAVSSHAASPVSFREIRPFLATRSVVEESKDFLRRYSSIDFDEFHSGATFESVSPCPLRRVTGLFLNNIRGLGGWNRAGRGKWLFIVVVSGLSTFVAYSLAKAFASRSAHARPFVPAPAILTRVRKRLADSSSQLW